MIRFLPLLLVCILLSGCTSFELSRVRNDIDRQIPEAKIGDGYAFSFGKISLGLARLFTGIADDDDVQLATTALKDVSRVQFAHYDVHGEVNASSLSMPRHMRRILEDDNWAHLATIREDNEAFWVLYNEDNETIKDLFVAALDAENLTLVKISGNLTAVVLSVLEEHQIDIPHILEGTNDPQEPIAGVGE